MNQTASPPPVVWFDGRLIDPYERVLSVMDHGVLVGDGVFESIRVVGGVPLAYQRHLERLGRSAAALGLTQPDLPAIERGVAAVLAATSADPFRLRITLTSGPGPLGSTRGDDPPTLFVIGTALAPTPAVAEVARVPWVRNERGPLAGIKSTSYAENAIALAAAQAQGAHEAILANTVGELCEGTGTNVFVVIDGVLCTPPLTSGCLAGVTRSLVIEVAGAREVALPFEALVTCEEAFLTSTTRGVQPIRLVDGVALAHCPGPVTRAAARALDRYYFG